MFSLSVVSDRYLLVTLSGKGSVSKYRALVSFVGDMIKTDGERRVLVDMLASEPVLTADEDRRIGQLAGRQWKPAQVALVVPNPDSVGAGVEAARKSGANIRAFSNLHDAGDWLKLGPDGPQ